MLAIAPGTASLVQQTTTFSQRPLPHKIPMEHLQSFTRWSLILAVCLLGEAISPHALAGEGDYPTTPVTIIVAYDPGGQGDSFTRPAAKSNLDGHLLLTFESVGALMAGFIDTLWGGLFVTADTPAAVLQSPNRHVNAVIAAPAVRTRFEAENLAVPKNSLAEFAAYLRTEAVKFDKLVKDAPIKVE